MGAIPAAASFAAGGFNINNGTARRTGIISSGAGRNKGIGLASSTKATDGNPVQAAGSNSVYYRIIQFLRGLFAERP